MCGGPIMWTSKKQPTVSTSTMEAEYVAVALAAKYIQGIHNILNEIGLKTEKLMTLFQDNNLSIAVANNPESTMMTKHIDIKHHYLRVLIQRNIICTE